MKKLLIAIAAIALLASCSKSDIAFDEPSEIAIIPVQKNMTKGVVTGNTFPANEEFNVFAWYNQVPAGSSASSWNKTSDTEYIKESPFVQRDADTWGGKTPYFWPKLGSLLFAGYYPTTIAANVDADVNKMTFTGIEQRWYEATGTDEDIMYFNTTETSHSSGPVSVVFKHALAWITVHVTRAEDNVTVTNGYPKIVIDEVTFTDIAAKGNGTVDAQNTIVWGTLSNVKNTTVNLSGTSSLSGIEKIELNQTVKTLQQPLVIPQSLNDQKLVVKYTVYSSETEFFKETYSQSLSGMKGKDSASKDVTVDKWEPAKHYIYNISVGLSEILIDPTVDNWTPVTVNVPVQ